MKRLFVLIIAAAVLVSAAATQEKPSPQPPPAQPASAVSLNDLVAEALRNNFGVQSALRMAEARRRRVPQARALPDPVLSIG